MTIPQIFNDPVVTSEEVQLQLQKVARVPHNDKVSFNRKRAQIEALVAAIHPIEQQIRDLTTRRQQLFDQISEVRQKMVDTCIHPIDQLQYNVDGTVTCKFCNRRYADISHVRMVSEQLNGES